MEHNLKILPEYFNKQILGEKHFEIRKDDRNYNVGDILNLQEFDGKKYTGRETKVTVKYIMKGGCYGLEKGFVIMSTEKYDLFDLAVVSGCSLDEALKRIKLLEQCREYDASGKNRPDGYIVPNFYTANRQSGE